MKGSKIHTIREDKHNRWFSGRMIHMATGARTKKYKQFDTRFCTSTQKITIEHIDDVYIKVLIDDQLFYCSSMKCNKCFFDAYIKYEKMHQLTLNDGFKSIENFFAWFNKDFTGKIIHWTDFKY